MVLETIKNNILKMTEEKSKQSISDLWESSSWFSIHIIKFLGEEEKGPEKHLR